MKNRWFVHKLAIFTFDGRSIDPLQCLRTGSDEFDTSRAFIRTLTLTMAVVMWR